MLAELVDEYKQSSKKLLGDVLQNVTKAGTNRVCTLSRAHLTSRS